jgi:hypothetical protein
VVELGVDAGGFSEFLLMHCDSCEQYTMVDLWGRSDAGQVTTTPPWWLVHVARLRGVCSKDASTVSEQLPFSNRRLATWTDRTLALWNVASLE